MFASKPAVSVCACAEQARLDSVTDDMIMCSMERGMLWMFLLGKVRYSA